MCKNVFLNKKTEFHANRPDPRYVAKDNMVVTTYSLGKLCQRWAEHSTLDAIKQHFSTLNSNVDFNDFLLGFRKRRNKRFIYSSYNEIWKVS